jgi:riboflavin biosynthesis pyrimidine reductase
MRLLLGPGDAALGHDLERAALRELYAAPQAPWLRVNFVSTLDGAATGADGRSGSINTEADHVVFELLRELSDVVVVGAGTVRREGYGVLRAKDPSAPPLAVVSNSGALPEQFLDGSGRDGGVLLLTRAAADPRNLAEARGALGDEGVIVCGTDEVDLTSLRQALHERGYTLVLSEGGPSLLGAMLSAGVVDELDLTWSPAIVGGPHPRIVAGPPVDLAVEPMLLIEEAGTLMGRWRVLAS